MHCIACNFDLQGLPANTCPECGRAFDPADASTFRARPGTLLSRNLARIILTIVLLIVLGLISGGYLVYRAANIAMQAEERLQATRFVADLIADHVENSPTHSWPTSWTDLEKLPHTEGIFDWPRESARFKAIVTIDFTTTTAAVLKQSPTNCSAVTIAPGPSFQGFPAMELQLLFDRLQALADKGLIPPQTAPPADASRP